MWVKHQMWIAILILLLLGTQLNLSGLVPLQTGDVPPPWWVGGRLLWPFAEETNTLLLTGDTLNTFTPILSITSALCFLLAAAALLRRLVPSQWFQGLIIAGVISSMLLQVIWFSGWAMLPLLVDLVLLWFVFREHVTVAKLRS
jgi:hypothetical protein